MTWWRGFFFAFVSLMTCIQHYDLIKVAGDEERRTEKSLELNKQMHMQLDYSCDPHLAANLAVGSRSSRKVARKCALNFLFRTPERIEKIFHAPSLDSCFRAQPASSHRSFSLFLQASERRARHPATGSTMGILSALWKPRGEPQTCWRATCRDINGLFGRG